MSAFARALYRVRGPLYYGAALVLIVGVLLGLVLDGGTADRVRSALMGVAVVVALGCAALAVLGPRLLTTRSPRTVHSPVQGRWLAINSPASAVPSHGVRAYGQAYAVDLISDPLENPRPIFGGPRAMPPASDYPALGQPVLAMIDGVVVRASHWRRDHRARANNAGVAYMMAEGMLREVGGPGFIVGNHVTIRGDDGIYALVAHLQQGSVTVSPGERVTAGQQIGRCGNSGNTSEPHVHAQLMDRASLWTAQGVPLAFAGIRTTPESAPLDGVPENGQHLLARHLSTAERGA
ncbi:M23 family metallopeptidase [Microbacterium sp. zg-Y818]|uniref:M23 family metallopeptidase n=1 Tax=unclassified Microbacterium TaxID=2609290 RepID=UPI00214B7013|nr:MULTISPECIES: M23 family metallopeptidase [unclassified Microbacterium]MCR2801118.1 M23 family metallopeptidase [Microbacterium sp. zg.Y818]WIM23818.1 M23 family metallopeptidase [Microbacterium sp. zg-Y818]